jgi:hypothetical protein
MLVVDLRGSGFEAHEVRDFGGACLVRVEGDVSVEKLEVIIGGGRSHSGSVDGRGRG